MPKETFFVVGAGVLQVPMIQTARSTGYEVFVTDGNPYACGFDVASDGKTLDTYNIEGHVKLVQQLMDTGVCFQGVATCGADVAPTVAAIAETAKLPGISFFTASNTHNKAKVREILHAYGLNDYQPCWERLSYHGNTRDEYLEMCLKEWGGVVIKPLEERASRGVRICRTRNELYEALQVLPQFLTQSMRFLAEEPLEGTEHSAEIIYAKASQPIFFNIVDRMFRYQDGYAIEQGHVSPSRLLSQEWEKIREVVEDAAAALGVDWGPFKCDLIWTKDGPKILECTARLSGGFDCQETIYASHRDPIYQTILLATDTLEFSQEAPGPYGPYSFGDYTGEYSACCAAFPRPGKILALPEEDPIFDIFGNGRIVAVHITSEVNQILTPYHHCAQRPGFVVTRASDYNTAWACAELAAKKLAEGFITLDANP